MKYYPVFLNLKGKKAVVVGGGKVAERKVLSLIKAGADVTVISPTLSPRLSRALRDKKIRHSPRSYKRGDVRGAFLAVAATDSPEINGKVSADAPGLVNVVDVPDECNFIASSVVERGPLLIAVSTSGASPALARTLRKELERLYGPEMCEYLRLVERLRTRAKAMITDKDERESFLKGLGSEEILRTVRSKGAGAVRKELLRRLKKAAGQ